MIQASPTHNTPKTAVIIAAYNAQATLPQTLASLASSLIPVHIYIVDDCSNPPLPSTFSAGNHTVQVLHNPHNMGQSASRNRAMRQAAADGCAYLAICDADDLCRPGRLAAQVSFLQANPTIGAVGTWAQAIREDGHPLEILRVPTQPDIIHHSLPVDSCFIHPTVMFRASSLQAMTHGGMYYDESLRNAEDYDLLYRLSRTASLANLPEVLLDYRISTGGISLTRVRAQRRARLLVQLRHFRLFSWQAWYGVARSALRLLIPNHIMDVIHRLKSYKPTSV